MHTLSSTSQRLGDGVDVLLTLFLTRVDHLCHPAPAMSGVCHASLVPSSASTRVVPAVPGPIAPPLSSAGNASLQVPRHLRGARPWAAVALPGPGCTGVAARLVHAPTPHAALVGDAAVGLGRGVPSGPRACRRCCAGRSHDAAHAAAEPQRWPPHRSARAARPRRRSRQRQRCQPQQRHSGAAHSGQVGYNRFDNRSGTKGLIQTECQPPRGRVFF